jgi:hypothetical protein
MKKNLLSKSAMLLRDTYQLYAKMLAVENIKVVFDEAISVLQHSLIFSIAFYTFRQSIRHKLI